jgi:hypothetical protein
MGVERGLDRHRSGDRIRDHVVALRRVPVAVGHPDPFVRMPRCGAWGSSVSRAVTTRRRATARASRRIARNVADQGDASG